MAQKAELVKGIGSLMGYGDMMRFAAALWKMALEENGHDPENAFLPAYPRWVGDSSYYKEGKYIREDIDALVKELKGRGIEP